MLYRPEAFGNGYAFLKTFERARRFAMHALDQVDRARSERGHGRYSLWTSDIGTALFAADCLDSASRYPIVDSLD